MPTPPFIQPHDGTVLLQGVVGSTAYGLATPDSDVDRLAVHVARTETLFTLNKPQETIVRTSPDFTSHEAAKFCTLALKCNPTVLELLWLPKYETQTTYGYDLIDIRRSFLNAVDVRAAWLGYAKQQIARMQTKLDAEPVDEKIKRLAKHARHVMRLLLQLQGFYTTGELTITLTQAQITRIRYMENRVIQIRDGIPRELEECFTETVNIADGPTPLPPAPNINNINLWLSRVRRAHLDREAAIGLDQ